MKRWIACVLLLGASGCVTSPGMGEVVTSVRRTKTGDLAVERCDVSLTVVWMIWPVAIGSGERTGCHEKVLP